MKLESENPNWDDVKKGRSRIRSLLYQISNMQEVSTTMAALFILRNKMPMYQSHTAVTFNLGTVINWVKERSTCVDPITATSTTSQASSMNKRPLKVLQIYRDFSVRASSDCIYQAPVDERIKTDRSNFENGNETMEVVRSANQYLTLPVKASLNEISRAFNFGIDQHRAFVLVGRAYRTKLTSMWTQNLWMMK
mmetsp:Transcript_34805/g.40989  ORF Transcript_34805/g.40989 Transcript_34805/m.40989 type:complete len:194 (-) Transcript_34805:385-966(-)